MIEHILTLSPVATWLLASLGLLLIELATPGLFFFISFAFGCLFGALGAALGYSAMVQCSVALLVTGIQFNAMRRRLRQFTHTTTVPTNTEALIGKRGVVLKPLDTVTPGLVMLHGQQWAAQSEDPIAIDHLVEVIRIEGNKVIVRAVTQED